MCAYMAVQELIKDEGSARKLFAMESTSVFCIAYVVMGVRSFMHARAARKNAEHAVKQAESAGGV